jgi:hypothetical protein
VLKPGATLATCPRSTRSDRSSIFSRSWCSAKTPIAQTAERLDIFNQYFKSMPTVKSDVACLQSIQIAGQAFRRGTLQNWLKKGASDARPLARRLHTKSGQIPVRFPHLAFVNCTEAIPHRLIAQEGLPPEDRRQLVKPKFARLFGTNAGAARRHL